MKRLNTLELFLTIITIGATCGASAFGYLDKMARDYEVGMSMAMETGYDGGAIAMVLIAAFSILGIVLIEIARFNKS